MNSLLAFGLLLLVVESLGIAVPAKHGGPTITKTQYAVKSVIKKVKPDSPVGYALDPARLPQNSVVQENAWVQLDCAAVNPSVSYRIQWWEYVFYPAGAPITDNELLFDHPNMARYTVVHNDPYQYSLMINPVVLADGGTYRCTDVNAAPPDKVQHGVSLTVIANLYNCSTTIISSGVVLDGQYVSNECQIDYQGGLIPNMTWSGPLPFDQGYVATPTTIWSGMHLNATRDMDTRAHTLQVYFTGYFLPVDADTADNVPYEDGYYQPPQMFIYWGPGNHTITPVQDNYEVGDVLTCYADARPPATFLWQNTRTNEIFSGPTLTIPQTWYGQNQTMRCQAQNTIEGTVYPSNTFLNVNVPVITTPTPATTPPTTTPPPAVAPCTDLTGGWTSTSPVYSLCIFLDLNNRGILSGLLKNGTDSFWMDLYGRAKIDDFSQVGFNGVWPLDVGVSSYAGECHRCFGQETLLVNSLLKTKGSPCGTNSPGQYGDQISFIRNTLLQCPNFPKP